MRRIGLSGAPWSVIVTTPSVRPLNAHCTAPRGTRRESLKASGGQAKPNRSEKACHESPGAVFADCTAVRAARLLGG
jgi:hypothetical protein